MNILLISIQYCMKVSITFDKNVNQQNKKQWLTEISTVVEKLNNQPSFENSPKTTIKTSPKAHSHKQYRGDHEQCYYASACKSKTDKSEKHEKYEKVEREYRENIKLQQQREDRKQMENCLINQLMVMQKIMEDKFGTVIGAITKLNEKVSHIEKRVSNLQMKQQQRATEQQDFNKEFAKITSKYVNIRRQSNSSALSKNNMRETAASGFSSYLDDR